MSNNPTITTCQPSNKLPPMMLRSVIQAPDSKIPLIDSQADMTYVTTMPANSFFSAGSLFKLLRRVSKGGYVAANCKVYLEIYKENIKDNLGVDRIWARSMDTARYKEVASRARRIDCHTYNTAHDALSQPLVNGIELQVFADACYSAKINPGLEV